LKNAWGLVSTALRDAKIPVPDVNLPAVPRSDGDFLDYEHIQTFLKAVRGDSVECAALLLLHSLRLSEAMMLTVDNISDGVIHVRGAVVVDKNNRPVVRAANKTSESSRDIPIMIPRLTEILPAEGPLITIARPTVQHRVKKICESAGLPPCSPHDLRRSFASLAKHLGWMPDTLMRIGGWSDMTTVNKIYAKLADKDADADIAKMQNYYQITTDSKSPVNKPSIEQK
jgi:integrase